jgi:ParB family chromosome partitioning protein
MSSRLESLAGLLSVEPILSADALLTEPEAQEVQVSQEVPSLNGNAPALVPLAKIKPSPFQPRTFFNQDKIDKMAASFRKYLEAGDYPKTAILVRPIADHYELIFGEQRKIAHERAGFTEILAFVDDSISDQESRELALTENLLREDLNPVEKADAILSLAAIRIQATPTEVRQLLDKAANDRKQGTDNVTRTSQWQSLEAFFQELPDRLSPESFRTNYLPLLNLPSDILNVLREGKLEYTKAKAIAALKENRQRQQLLRKTIENNLSIREVRAHVRTIKEAGRLPDAKSLLSQQLNQLNQQLKKSTVCDDPKRLRKLESLLSDLEQLLSH